MVVRRCGGIKIDISKYFNSVPKDKMCEMVYKVFNNDKAIQDNLMKILNNNTTIDLE